MAGEAETFGARLKRLREEAGLTQLQLGQAAGMHRFSVAKLERDEYGPTWATVQALAKALGLNTLAFEGTVEPTEETKQPGRRGRPKKKPADESPPASEVEPEPPRKRRRKKDE